MTHRDASRDGSVELREAVRIPWSTPPFRNMSVASQLLPPAATSFFFGGDTGMSQVSLFERAHALNKVNL
jgi:hypothetical protein